MTFEDKLLFDLMPLEFYSTPNNIGLNERLTKTANQPYTHALALSNFNPPTYSQRVVLLAPKHRLQLEDDNWHEDRRKIRG
jgi:hypothetical protein